MAATTTDVVVIGAGVVGAASAAALSRRGMRVTLVEAGPPTQGTSLANAGMVATSDIVAFAAPGMVREGLRSLVTRNGAFSLSPRARPATAGWLTRFARSANADNVQRALPVLHYLLQRSADVMRRMAEAGSDIDYRPSGLLQVYPTQDSWCEAQDRLPLLREHGIAADVIDTASLHDAEPLLRDGVGGVLTPGDGSVDPQLLVRTLVTDAFASGAEARSAQVTQLSPDADGITVVTDNGSLRCDHVVLAAGVWTPSLIPTGCPNIPIAAAKGHSVTIANLPEVPRRPLLLTGQHIAVTPLRRGLRITGGFELTRPTDRRVNHRRVLRIVAAAQRALRLPDELAPRRAWTGLRPVTPDGLPFIGPLPTQPRVFVAAGHGMLGTSMGPGTGELVADLLCGQAVDIDLAPLSIARFTSEGRR